MKLRLKYSPTPENAPKFAADMVVAAADVSGADLDYSAASVKTVDDILQGMRRDGCTCDQIGETLFGFGCYIGEVLVRQVKGSWRSSADTPLAKVAGFPLVVELGKERFCNPIGKVFKRLENGEQDNLAYFYQVFATEGGAEALH